MKIALVSSIFDQSIPGGGVTLSFNVVEEWLKQGHEVTIFCAHLRQRKIGNLEEYFDSGKLRIVPLISLEDTVLGHQLRDDVYRKVDDYLKSEKFDLVHVHNFHGLLSAVAAFQKNAIPSIYMALDFGLICPTWYLFEKNRSICDGPVQGKCRDCLVAANGLELTNLLRSVWKLATAIWNRYEIRMNLRYFNPKFRKKSLEAVYSLPAMKEILGKFDSVLFPSPATEAFLKSEVNGIIQRVRFPVSSSRISNMPKMNRKNLPLRLLYLGHSNKIKGWDFFLEVLDRLPDGLSLEVVDGGGAKASFLASSNRVKRYLKKSLKIATSDLAMEIKGSDAVVVPSLWHENTPLVVLEALANQTPVIASNQIGISHVVKDGKNGFLVRPGSVVDWSNFLQEIVNDPDKLRSLSGIAYEVSISDFLADIGQCQNKVFERVMR